MYTSNYQFSLPLSGKTWSWFLQLRLCMKVFKVLSLCIKMRHNSAASRLVFLSLFSLALAIVASLYWLRQIQTQVHALDLMSKTHISASKDPL
jgi:hypothetical protein